MPAPQGAAGVVTQRLECLCFPVSVQQLVSRNAPCVLACLLACPLAGQLADRFVCTNFSTWSRGEPEWITVEFTRPTSNTSATRLPTAWGAPAGAGAGHHMMARFAADSNLRCQADRC